MPEQIPEKMKALTFLSPGKIALVDKPVPKPSFGEALIRITTTTICGTDVHILKGEYPVKPGLTLGHEPVGVIAALGPGVKGYRVGQRVITGAITPCGQCDPCLEHHSSQCGGKAMGGWKFGNTIDGARSDQGSNYTLRQP
jgi:alcohol dehydrogenase